MSNGTQSDRPELAIRVMMMPRDTNAQGTIFGGVIMSYLDQAGAIEAHRHTSANILTVAMDSVLFKQPVFVGDVLSFFATKLKIGRTSIRIRVDVEALRLGPTQTPVPVTSAEITYVAVDDQRMPIPIGNASNG